MALYCTRVHAKGMWLLSLFLLTIQYGGHYASFVLADDGAVCDRSAVDASNEIDIEVGDTLTMSCSTDSRLIASEIIWHRDNAVIIDGGAFVIRDQRYSWKTVENDAGSCASSLLTIADIDLTDDGVYTCRGATTENGTVLVRVGAPTVTTRATPHPPTLPECSTNISRGELVEPSDMVELTCRTDPASLSGWSLDWIGEENTQILDEGTASSSVLLPVSKLLESSPTCALTCRDGDQECLPPDDHGGLRNTCNVDLVTFGPETTVLTEGEIPSFTCHVDLVGYFPNWFLPIVDSGSVRGETERSDDNQTSTITLHDLRANHSGQIICVIMYDNNIVGGQNRYARFSVVAPGEVTPSEVMPAEVGSTTEDPGVQTKVAMVYVRDLPGPNSSSTLPFDLGVLIAIVIGGTLVLVALVAFIGYCICRRRHHEKESMVVDSKPVMAFGNMAFDDPVNLDLHFNIYTSDDTMDEPSRASNMFDRDNSKRTALTNGQTGGDSNRVSTFYPVADHARNGPSAWRSDADERPGHLLNFYVENDIYISHDSYV